MDNKYLIWIIGILVLSSFVSANTLCDTTTLPTPEACYPFTADGNDAMGTHNLADIGDPAYASNGATLDGNDAIISTDTTFTSFGAGDFTICFNASGDWDGINNHILSHWNNGDDTGWRWTYYTDGIATANQWNNYGNALVDNVWYHQCLVRNGTGTNQMALFINGVLNKTFTSSKSLTPSTGMNFEVGRRSNPVGLYWTGTINGLWIKDDDITAQNVADIYNLNFGGVTPTIVVKQNSPVNGITNNAFNWNLTYNVTNNYIGISNCSLFINGVFNQSNSSSVSNTSFNNFTLPVGLDGYYNWSVVCFGNASVNGSCNGNFIMDASAPTLTTNYLNNSYTTLNNTYQFNYSDNIMLWKFNVSIDGVLKYNLSNISASFYPYNHTLNGSNYSLGVHNLSSVVCDAHTSNLIPAYDVNIKTPSTIKFNDLVIKSLTSASSVSYGKEMDRYHFGFGYDVAYKSIQIEMPKGCVYINSNKYKGWFVCGNNWVDFENSDYYDVKVSGNVVTIISPVETKFFNFNSVGELNCRTYDYVWNNMGRLNITARNYTGGVINNFDIYKNGVLLDSSTSGSYNINNLSVGTYNVAVDNPAYELVTYSIPISLPYTEYNTSLYNTNSVNFTIKDEKTNSIILFENTTIITYNPVYGESTYYANGSYYIQGFQTGEWSFTFDSASYSPRTYTLNILNRTHNSLTAYLVNESSTIFTITDKDTTIYLNGVFCTMYKNIGGSWQIVSSQYSDISGKTQFYYNPSVNYMFNLEKSGYETYVFYLNPILFSSYDIQMEKTTLQNVSQDYDKISVLYYPTSFINNNITSFGFLIQNPYSELNNYGFIITYPNAGTSQIKSSSGSNPVGSLLSASVNITGASGSDLVRLDYYYTTNLSGLRNFTIFFPISYLYDSNNTFIKNKYTTYGLGLFERLLIFTLIILFVVGITSLTRHTIEGMALGMFVMGYMVFIGFIPIWSILISMFVGFMILSWRSGG